MNQTNPEILGIIVTIGTLFGWLLKQVVSYFIAKQNEKDAYIKELVRANQKNVDEFKQTINHNQTKMNSSIDNLAKTMKDQTEVFKQLIKEK